MWTIDGAIYALADSAVTWQEQPTTTTSSFDDRVVRRGSAVIEEAACKIFQLGQYTLGMIAGDAHMGQQAMQALRGRLDGVDLLAEVQSIIGGPGEISGCELLVGRVRAGRPEIVVFDGQCFLTTNGCAIIGSLSLEHTQQLGGLIENLSYQKLLPHQRLVIMVAYLRAIGIQHPIIEDGVGGAMYGALIGCNGIEWQLDTSFIIFDPRLTDAVRRSCKGQAGELITIELDSRVVDDMTEVRVAARDGVVAVVSNLTGTVLLVNDLVLSGIENWKQKWLQNVSRSIENHGAQFIVFISCISPHVIVVDRLASKDTYIRPHGNGKSRMPWAFSADLMNELLSPSGIGGHGRLRIFNQVERYPVQNNPHVFLFAYITPMPRCLANIDFEHINPVGNWLHAQQRIHAIFPNIDFGSNDGMLKFGADRWDFHPFRPYGVREESSVIVSMNHWRVAEGQGDFAPVLSLAQATGWTAIDPINGQLYTAQGVITL